MGTVLYVNEPLENPPVHDLVIHLSDEQLNKIRKISSTRDIPITKVLEELLSSIYPAVEGYLDGAPQDQVEFKFRTGAGQLIHVQIPSDVVHDAQVLVDRNLAIQAIKLIREKCGFGLLEAKYAVDILRGLEKNLA